MPSVAQSSPMQASPAIVPSNLPGNPPGLPTPLNADMNVTQGMDVPNPSQVFTDITMNIGVHNEEASSQPASDQVRNSETFQGIHENVLFSSTSAPVPGPVLQMQEERVEFFHLASDREIKQIENMHSQTIDLLMGSDRLQAYVSSKLVEDVESNMYFAQKNMLVRAKGYANYFLGEDTPLQIVDDSNLVLGPSVIRGMAQIVGSALSVGPSAEDVWKNSEVLAGLDNLSWFRLATAVMASVARGCGQVPNIHRRGNYPVDYAADSFTYSNSLEAPTSQMDIVQKLAAQIYSSMGGLGEDADPSTRAINICVAQWECFEWAIRSKTAT